MQKLHEGWLYKASNRKVGVGAATRRLYGVLSSRAIYFYMDDGDAEPFAYIRLEAVVCRHLAHKAPRSFELRPAVVDGKEGETRMVKFKDSGDGVPADRAAQGGARPARVASSPDPAQHVNTATAPLRTSEPLHHNAALTTAPPHF